jgi:proteic killer suppression protein
MIRSFRHKGLELLHQTGSARKVQTAHAKRLKLILTMLSAATKPEHMNAPGLGLHPLKGDRKGFWAVEVSGNWRVIFRFEEGHAFEVDYVDYH